MLRFTLLFLLPMVISVTGQEGNNQPIRRSRPIPVLGRLRSVRPIQSASPPPQTPVVASAQLPVTAATQPPQSVSAPQVTIPVVADTQTSVATAQAPVAVTPVQPPVVPPHPPVGLVLQTTASTDIQPPLAAVSSSRQPEVHVVPVKPEDELATYESEPESEPELELETETEPEPELEPELQAEPAAQSVLKLAAHPVLELAAQPVPDQAPQYKPEIRPQINFVVAPQSAAKPVAFKPAPSALPPLLPKPQPVWDSDLGRQTRLTTQFPITVSTQRVTKAPPVIIITSTTQRPRSLKLDLFCKGGNGYYAVDNGCDSYIECKYNKATQRWCPDGLHFNPAAKLYEYPCAYPSVVKCTAGNERQNPNPTAQCPRQYGFFSTNDGDCSKYVVCQEGAATTMDCPSGLVFNPTVQSCDWVENAPQCNPNVFKNYVCPEPPIGEDGLVSDIIYRYRYEQQCNLYIACHRGYPRLLSCDHGLSFHEGSQSCIEEEYVLDCATPRS